MNEGANTISYNPFDKSINCYPKKLADKSWEEVVDKIIEKLPIILEDITVQTILEYPGVREELKNSIVNLLKKANAGTDQKFPFKEAAKPGFSHRLYIRTQCENGSLRFLQNYGSVPKINLPKEEIRGEMNKIYEALKETKPETAPMATPEPTVEPQQIKPASKKITVGKAANTAVKQKESEQPQEDRAEKARKELEKEKSVLQATLDELGNYCSDVHVKERAENALNIVDPNQVGEVRAAKSVLKNQCKEPPQPKPTEDEAPELSDKQKALTRCDQLSSPFNGICRGKVNNESWTYQQVTNKWGTGK